MTTTNEATETQTVIKKGRPASTPFQTAKREAIKAARDMLLVEQELQDSLCLEDADEARITEVKSIARDRLTVAARLVKVLDTKIEVSHELKNAKRQEDQRALTRKVSTLRTQEGQLYKQLWTLPELGATQDEWDNDYDESMKKRPLGRPGLTVEVRVVRARLRAEETEREFRKLEVDSGSRPPLDITEEAKRKLVSKGRKTSPGKPRLDELGKLDKRLQLIDRKIEAIEAEKDVKAQVKKSSNGVSLGRKRKSKDEKIAPLRADRAVVVGMIEQAEKILSDSAKAKRMVKSLRDQARRIKLKANEESDQTAKLALLTKYQNLRDQAKKTEESADTLSQIEEMERLSESKKVPENLKPSQAKLDELTEAKIREIRENEERMIEAIESIERQANLAQRMTDAKNKLARLNTPTGSAMSEHVECVTH